MPSKTFVPRKDNWESVCCGAAGLWLALALIKFGNPVILDEKIPPPSSWEEFLLYPWPVAWGYGLLVGVGLLGLRFWRWRIAVPRWLLALPLVWLSWLGLSALQTVQWALTVATLKHFVACAMAFYLGAFALSQLTTLRSFWIGLLGGFLVVALVGWKQHFGGLEETRRQFFSLPDWKSYPAEFVEKVASNRIYSTLFYPNALAGVVVLLLPISISILWETGRIWPMPVKLIGAGTFAFLGLGCLYWSGSKAGWLLGLGQSVMVFLHSRLKRNVKVLVIVLALLGGSCGFLLKHRGYFERGATSVSARFDYWKAAWQTLQSKPLLGSGPGTFMVSYKSLKLPEAEMSRLAHNDFLQQGCDSGWVGLLAYLGWILGSLGLLYRRSVRSVGQETFGIWLGLCGVSLQGLVEFGLYIPALSWTTFLLFGMSLARWPPRNQIDKRQPDF